MDNEYTQSLILEMRRDEITDRYLNSLSEPTASEDMTICERCRAGLLDSYPDCGEISCEYFDCDEAKTCKCGYVDCCDSAECVAFRRVHNG